MQREFGRFGKILEINFPLKDDNKTPKGFAFIQFDSFQAATAAIKEKNLATFLERQIIIDHALQKNLWLKNPPMPAESNQEKASDQGLITSDTVLPSNLEDQASMGVDSKMKSSEEELMTTNRQARTLFIRNLSFMNTEQDLKVYFGEKFGPV